MRAADLLPGLALLALIGAIGWGLGTVTPIPGLVAAVVVGAFLGNTRGYSARFTPGVGTYKLWLETGIVLMGAGITIDAVLDAGPTVLGLVLAVVTGTLLFVELTARRVLSVPEKLASLLAAGASICGVSAVVSVAGSIEAEDSHVAYASAAVLAFDAVTLVVYPAVGAALSLPDIAYGVWAGTTMFSTGPVTAAGFAYSETAGRWAVLVKLARNTLIGVVTVGYALYYSRREAGSDAGDAAERPGLGAVVAKAPRFLVGFLLLAVLGNTVLSGATVSALTTLSDGLFLLAFAGLGLALRLKTLRAAGLGPLAVLAVSLVTFSTAVLGVVSVLF
ncbi:MAG: YeiH family protein [Halolamina sp.]